MLELFGDEVDKAVEADAGHYMNEQTGHLVETVENHRVSPHGDGNGIVSEGETVCADEESLRIGKEPYSAHAQEIDEITEISQEVVVTPPMVCVPTNGHEV